jgi:hypothetical protein
VKLQAPQADELGFARALAVQEIGGTKCLVLQQDSKMGQISTVVLRGSTDQVGGWVGSGGGGSGGQGFAWRYGSLLTCWSLQGCKAASCE